MSRLDAFTEPYPGQVIAVDKIEDSPTVRRKVRLTLSFEEWNSICYLLVVHLSDIDREYANDAEMKADEEHIVTLLKLIEEELFICRIFFSTFWDFFGDFSDTAEYLSEDENIARILEKGKG